MQQAALGLLLRRGRYADIGVEPPPGDERRMPPPPREGGNDSDMAAGGKAAGGARQALLVLEIALITVIATLLISRVGMMVATAGLLLALVKLLGGSWRAAAGSAVVLPIALYLVFARWLMVPVPTGPWGF